MALTLTATGLEMLQKLQTEEVSNIEFTKIAIGDGEWTKDEINLGINTLKNPRIETGVSGKKTELRGENTIVVLSGTLRNENITTSFYVREVGLYARYNDSEVLYSFDIVPIDEIPQAIIQSNVVPQNIPIILDTAISNISAVDITITNDIHFVIKKEFDEYKNLTTSKLEEIKLALDTKQPVGDYATNEALNQGLASKQTVGDYATNQALQNGLNSKLNITGGTINGSLNVTGNLTNAGTYLMPRPDSKRIHNKPTISGTIPSGGTWLGVTYLHNDGIPFIRVFLMAGGTTTNIIGSYIRIA